MEVGAELIVLTSNSFMNRLVMKGANGGTHGNTMDLFKILTLEEKVGAFNENLQ